MKLRVRSELVYRFDPPTDAIYQIQVAHWPGQEILEETLTTTPPVAFHCTAASAGQENCTRPN